MTSTPAFGPESFTWALGIEDTCVYPASAEARPLDEHVLTGHVTAWREDITVAAELGATALRYGMSWPLVHTAPGEFDWTTLDQVVEHAVVHHGLTLVADLVHYGTPPWLAESFADPRYPAAIEEFADALATRYAGKITHFTPLNEPVTTASFCGLRGVWPPGLTGWDGWTAVAVPVALGIVRAIRVIRRRQPDAQIVHVEAATQITANDAEYEPHAQLLTHIGWLPTDLVLGRVTTDHPMREWLIQHGAEASSLDWLVQSAVEVDLIGVNYYPDLTPRRLLQTPDGVQQLSYERGGVGLREALTAFGDRYDRPLAVTETSIEGDDDRRRAWLAESVQVVHHLRAEGMDLRGYTWWPLFDFVDWSWAAGGANVEEFAVAQTTSLGTIQVGPAPPLGDPAEGKTAFLRRMGLVRLVEDSDGTLQRRLTAAATDYTSMSLAEPHEAKRGGAGPRRVVGGRLDASPAGRGVRAQESRTRSTSY
jgi:beta-glucosidase